MISKRDLNGTPGTTPWKKRAYQECLKGSGDTITDFRRKRAEYCFGEHGFKHRTQWVFRGSLSSGERTQRVPLSLLFVCQSELTEFFAELSEFAPKLTEAQWVLFSETVLSKQYSARFLFPQKWDNASLGIPPDLRWAKSQISFEKGLGAYQGFGATKKNKRCPFPGFSPSFYSCNCNPLNHLKIIIFMRVMILKRMVHRNCPGSVAAFSWEFLAVMFMCFLLCPRKRQHTNNFRAPPVPRTTLKVVYVYGFLFVPNGVGAIHRISTGPYLQSAWRARTCTPENTWLRAIPSSFSSEFTGR